MTLEQIDYFICAAQSRTFFDAAEAMHISQSSLSKQIMKLEKELGTPLFHRSRPHWCLTEAGRIYIEGAQEALRIKNRGKKRTSPAGKAG